MLHWVTGIGFPISAVPAGVTEVQILSPVCGAGVA